MMFHGNCCYHLTPRGHVNLELSHQRNSVDRVWVWVFGVVALFAVPHRQQLWCNYHHPALLVSAFIHPSKSIHQLGPIRRSNSTFQQRDSPWNNQIRLLERKTNRHSNVDDNDDSSDDETIEATKHRMKSDLISRFTSPVIDDPGLPLSDVLIAQVIGPSLQIAWLSLQQGPLPTWLRPIFDTDVLYTNQGSLVAPALIHGAALASCWIAGALAAKAYERKSISPVFETSNKEWDYSNVVLSILKGGAFATGLLILATQIDLLLEFGRYVQFGESDEVDFRILVASVEVTNDIIFEAVTVFTWRVLLAYQTERIAQE
jgi:hypothetical protein